MNPVLLQKQFRDNTKDLQNFCKELQEWGEEMKRKEEPCKSGAANDAEVPPDKVQKTEHSKETEEEPKTAETKKSKRIKSSDYKAWEKFNADAYCERMDKETVGEPLSDDASDDLSDEYDGSMVELANCEKEKGNAFVKKQRWDDAIKCYTKAVECYAYEPIFYANRALCHLKKQNYRNAESDCTAAIQLDKKYVKAYQRRAAARESLNQLNEARDDLLRVLELEKKNAESKAALVKLEKKIEDSKKQPVAETRRPISKFTLSRQTQKHPPVPEATSNSKNEEIPAVKAHVVEKVAPSLPAKFEDWPGGNGVELFASLPRPRKSRSAGPLKRIEIIDVDLQIEPQVSEGLTKSILETDENESKLQATVSRNEEDTLKLVEEMFQQSAKPIPSPPKNKAEQTVVKRENSDLQVPRTSVQFYKGWKSIGADQDFRYRYMKQINPKELPDIFKESLESKVFSEMIESLSAAQDRNFIHDWLTQLTNVKRFSALVMFMSSAEKRRVSDLVAYLREDNKFDEVEELRKKYEL